MKIERVAVIRRNVCARAKCSLLDKIDYHDPSAACPNGHWHAVSKGSKIANAIDAVATPVARALKLPCIDPETKELRPESPCAKVKANLHSGMNLADAFYDGYFRKPEPKE